MGRNYKRRVPQEEKKNNEDIRKVRIKINSSNKCLQKERELK